jgi:hypothetical protein
VDRTASRRNACTKTSPQALDEPAALLLRFFLDFGFETEYGMATNGSRFPLPKQPSLQLPQLTVHRKGRQRTDEEIGCPNCSEGLGFSIQMFIMHKKARKTFTCMLVDKKRKDIYTCNK